MTNERVEWLKARRSGIGGSDVAACLGLNPWRTPVQVWEDKTGRAEHSVQSENAYWGTMLENLVAKEFEKRLGMKVQRVNRILRDGENGWMIANIDRAIINPDISGNVRVIEDADKIAASGGRRITTNAILECKTAHAFTASDWGDTQEYEIATGELVSEHKIPIHYETQVQWYLGVTGASVCYVAVLIGGSDFRVYRIERDEECIATLREKCWEFWSKFVLADTPPEPINIEDVKRLFKVDDGEMAEADNETAADIGEYVKISEQIKQLDKEKGALALRITNTIGEMLGLTIGGNKACTFKSVTSKRFDSKRFKIEHPALWDQYAVESTNRIFKTYY